jgi:hypothetical protein
MLGCGRQSGERDQLGGVVEVVAAAVRSFMVASWDDAGGGTIGAD